MGTVGGLHQHQESSLSCMKMRIVKDVPMMKISCLVLPPYTSCLDAWTPRVRFEGAGAALAVPERAQGGGTYTAAFLEA